MNRVFKLSDIALLNRETYKKNELPTYLNYLDTGNLTKNKINELQKIIVSEEKIPSRAQRKVRKKTILYSTVRPIQKHYGFIDEDIENLIVSTGFTTIDVIDDEVYPKYLFYKLTQNHIVNYLHSLAVNSVSSYPSISPSELANLEFKFPPFNKQKQIAKVLSDIDAKIDLNQKINAELEAMAKTIYDYWFVQFDFPDENGKPYKSSGGKMVYNEELKREIPEGWKVKPLTEEMDLQYGFPFSTQLFNNEAEGIPVVRIRDILNRSISNHSTEKVNEKYKLKKGDLLVGMDGNFHINYWDKNNCYLNQRCLRIRAKKNSISEIQVKYLIEPYIKAKEKNISRTTVGHLGSNDINDLKVIKAKRCIQNDINKSFNAILKQLIINNNENQELTALRDWLLPMLMNGQVSVKESDKRAGLSVAAEPQAQYGPLNFPEKVGNDFALQIAAIVLQDGQKNNGFVHGKTGIQKTAFFAKVAFNERRFQNTNFKNYYFGTYSEQIEAGIKDNPYLVKTKVSNNKEVYKIAPQKKEKLLSWLNSGKNESYKNNLDQILEVYQDQLINNDIYRIELLNTVYKIILDHSATDLNTIWEKMQKWFINKEKTQSKADKFNKTETIHTILLIRKIGWI